MLQGSNSLRGGKKKYGPKTKVNLQQFSRQRTGLSNLLAANEGYLMAVHDPNRLW